MALRGLHSAGVEFAMRMLGWAAMVGLLGCTPEPACEEGFEPDAEGTCVPVETDDSDDTDDTNDTDDSDDTDDTDVELGRIRVEIDVDALPSDNVFVLTCDGRRLLRADAFTFFTTLTWDFEVVPGEVCTLDVEDVRGGLLFGGRLVNCSLPVADWAPERGLSKRLAEVTVFGCVPGCADPVAENYQERANLDDGSCVYILGCTDERALNFDPFATKNDGSCDFGGFGPLALTVFTDGSPNDNSVRIVCQGAEALELGGGNPWTTVTKRTVIDAGYECSVIVEDDVGDEGPSGFVEHCGEVVASWPRTPNADAPYALEVGGFFSQACSGCTDPVATNYDVEAKVEDGTCTYAP